MATIYVDGQEYVVNKSDNLLQACLSLGFDIPYFCWHPALGSIGACRQCAIKQYQNAEDKHGRLVMSCMTPVQSGSFISINDDEAKQFRKSVIELMMINHPHDCPVCEEGGHCHLQDMTVMVGHSLRRYRFTKRTYYNQELGPFISHEMNRCIACYRCVRYYKDYADGKDFDVYGAHDNLYFGRTENGTLENEFAGNLIEICPTGVFTDKNHSERYNRKWDMQFSPSICSHCSVGCNISIGERYGEIRRIENRYNGTINHYFLCDLGRFGYGYINLKNRPRQPRQRFGNDWIFLSADQAIQNVANILREAKKTIGIGSPRASLESNYALRELVGANNFYSGIEAGELSRLNLIQNILRKGGVYTPSLREIESYDAILILGEDVTQTAARIALALRQAVKSKARVIAEIYNIAYWHSEAIANIGQKAKYPLFITSIDDTRLDDIAAISYHAPFADQARLGFAIAHALDNNAPLVKDLSYEVLKIVDIIVQELSIAKKILIITGSNTGYTSLIEAAANIEKALKVCNKTVGITFIVSEANSMGVAMMNAPSMDDALNQLEEGIADSVVVLENDLYRHALAVRINTALSKVHSLIVIDHQWTSIMNKANIVLSAASFAESDGTLVNQEGRAQRFFQVYDPVYYDDPKKKPSSIMLESWRWMHFIHAVLKNQQIDWTCLDHVIISLVKSYPYLQGIVDAAPNSMFRIKGQKLARAPHRYSGRTAMRANISVHEPRQPQDKDTAFTFSMEGYCGVSENNQHIPFAWAPGWNSPQAWNKFQDKIGGHLRYGDPGIRLIATNTSSLNYFTVVPQPYRNIGWIVVPYYHLFGSEEMSQRSPVIQAHMPEACIIINFVDALKLGINNGAILELTFVGQQLILPVRLSKNLQLGQIGLPLGLPGISPVLNGSTIHNIKTIKT
ncbi:NADH-quinone oxidoreductase subunit G [Candidatus Profftia lariciata]|uniref:NADH-quinone oxidoreductase subunit NuoG n=1 Tax=Candidatus Profftia lariciata TaxID=1987921 RepID=UPI001D012065|nr:NADH-quinone oxidoreductase subunit NuoG [Candidatus Profftia lariciata]UDG81657.1 NADH-quinone oxidoreductase subunit G [Candidatus Profftia lariciata]